MAQVTGGNQISSTAQILDGTIETADIADDAVSMAKLAEGVEGDVLTMGATEPGWAAPASIPAGTILPYAGSAAPSGYLLANGAVVSQATYATLYGVIGHTFAADPGGGNFTLPSLKGKVPVGLDSGQTEFDTRGETGGAKTHTLTEAEMPAHTHTTGANTGTASAGPYILTKNTTDTSTSTTNSTGGGGAHNNLQPYLVLHYIIKT